MAHSLTVRRAGAADKAAWTGLWRAWQEHMSGTVPGAVTERSWEMIQSPETGLHALLAFNAETAIGMANVSLTPFAWTGTDILFLQDLFVKPDARGLGAGSALLEAVYALADELKATQVFWMVDETDARLQAFYARHARRTPYLRFMRTQWPW